ncbi:GDP-L-fucose synthase [Methylomarinum sp. Ch1-1]|uniref:GDP-L-fucose synthase n=1 Tax=Methylomarinum roseum TaxID=3067653 RepID=A0AAU7NPV7_9GAMM|nr:GDP-L-fucose synthase [Methylomarinum sp. Ch1-1]MDP4521077.1 GDP-L-fucose synthase [Methylomarinum sp. Ch1-1]
MQAKKRVYVAGHNGMVGAALVRQLQQQDNIELVLRSHGELDLTRQDQVEAFFNGQALDEVYLAAAKVGGIHANHVYPAEFIYQNLMIECNVIHAAHRANVQKLLLLGSSCIYPKHAEQPMSEDALLTGALEPTNEPYAIAKIAGIKLCESYNRQYGRDYRSVMPTNLYGPHDNFHPENSHVIPALLRRVHEAKINQVETVTIWGSGQAKREFMFVDDMARACIFVMTLTHEAYGSVTQPMLSHINVGTGSDYSIRTLAMLLCEIIGYSGCLLFDSSKPDGAPRKLLDVSRLNALGWQAQMDLPSGIRETYRWYLEHEERLRRSGR